MNFAPEGGGEQMWMGEGGGNVLSQWWRCWAGHIMQRGWGGLGLIFFLLNSNPTCFQMQWRL